MIASARLLGLCCIFSGLTSALPSQQLPLAPPPQKHASRGQHAAVSCESDICTKVGIQLSEDGGNAADMIVGTVLCVGVVAMYHSGIGGGGFALIHAANGSFRAIDFREPAPQAAHPYMFEPDPLTQYWGGLASGIPGELKGLQYIHDNFGSLAWADVVAPAARIARAGWTVDSDLLRYMDLTVERREDFFTLDPAWAEDFAPGGHRVRVGDQLARPRYADTLDIIARDGADAFYLGRLANATVAANRAGGGLFTLQDMADYRLEVREPLTVEYQNHSVTTCPAPAGGASMLSILKTMEGYADELADPAKANLTSHRLNEAFRFAFGARARMADPNLFPGVPDFEKGLITDEYGASVRERISDDHTLDLGQYNPSGYDIGENHGTSHIVASDSSGLTISLTSTVNFYFGSTIIVPESGIILNNQMADFSTPYPHPPFYFPPSPSNLPEPGTRPLSACSPTIVKKKAAAAAAADEGSMATAPSSEPPMLTLGAAGGPRIITLVATLVLTLLPPYMQNPALGSSLSAASSSGASDASASASSGPAPLSLAQALALPRLHDGLVPNETSLEWPEPAAGVPGYDNATAAFLARRGHHVNWVRPKYSAAHALAWTCNSAPPPAHLQPRPLLPPCGFFAAAEPRHLNSGARVR